MTVPVPTLAAARRAALEEAASWHDAEAARLDAVAAAVRPEARANWIMAGKNLPLADEHRRSAAALRAMKDAAP